MPEDVFKALSELGFGKYEDGLREFMRNYRGANEEIPGKKTLRK
jgi:hypothetical protein